MSVSVIMPTYNAEATLERAVASVLSQTRAVDEILVVDDGSSDRTTEIARSLDSKVRVIQQSHMGAAAARNRGMAAAAGGILSFLDADDRWRPEYVEQCAGFLDRHPDAIAVNSATKIFGIGTAHVEPLIYQQIPAEGLLITDFFDYWAAHDQVRTSSLSFRKSAYEAAGPMLEDLTISEDLEYFGYLATFGKFGFIGAPLSENMSTPAAVDAGWWSHHRERRIKCASVEDWQRRITPRLEPRDWPGFRVVRGRVAAWFTHAYILSGRREDARTAIERYGDDMPDNRLTRLLRTAARTPSPGWELICHLVTAREWSKGFSLQVQKRLAGQRTTG